MWLYCLFFFPLLLKIGECQMMWQWILIIQTLVSQENPEDFSRRYFCRKKHLIRKCCTVIWAVLNVLDRLQSIRICHEYKTSIQLTFDEKCSISEFCGRIFKAYQLTSGVQFNQWKVLLVAQRSMNRTRTIAVVPEIIIWILLADIYICFQTVCVCFSVLTVQHQIQER